MAEFSSKIGGKFKTDSDEPTNELTQPDGEPKRKRFARRPGSLGNQRATVHGGEGGVKSLIRGEDLHGLAAQSQREVESELESEGRAVIVKRAAIRLEAVSRLFFNAILAAADAGNVTALAHYAQRYAWLQARSLAAWKQVKAEGNGDNAPDYEKIIEVETNADNAGH